MDDYVSASAALFGLLRVERVPRWAERVRTSLPDLQRLAHFDCPAGCEPFGWPREAGLADGLPAEEGAAPRAGTLDQLAQEVGAGRTDPVARVEAALAAIDRHAGLNAFRYVDAAGALARARSLRERVGRGGRAGRLAGVLLAVKDCFQVAGLPATSGTRALPVQVPERSATVVERLLLEDAIVVGMTTMHELAYGATSDNPHFGRVRHPVDPGRLPGGSSGGSAVAVACAMADAALGTDTAGSVRMPAALCGITGFKPTFGALPTDGMLPLAWSLDHVGTFAAAAGDHALLHEVMAGLPAGTLLRPVPATVRATAITNYVLAAMDPEVALLYQRGLERLREAGVLIETQAIAHLELAPTLQHFTIAPEAAQVHADRALRNPEGIGEEVRVRLEAGQFVRAVDYLKAQRLRGMLHDALAAPLAAGSDVLITPAVAIPAPVPGATVQAGNQALPIHPALTRCTLPFNLSGMPAIAVPCGRTAAGLPVGLQLAAMRGDDARLLAIARRMQELLAQG